MATITEPAITPDTVMSFDINRGTILQLLATRPEKGPRLKCFEGSVTLVSPGRSHEEAAERLAALIMAICQELGLKFNSLASTTWTLPFGAGDTAYEADKAYYIQNHGTTRPDHPPDLAIEIVVSHPETKALRAGALLKIPELWVYDLPRRQLTLHELATRGKSKGMYRPATRSRAFPSLTPADVLERLDDPESDSATFQQNCRNWARRELVPRGRDNA